MGQKFWQIYINNRSQQQNFFIFIWILQLKENILVMISPSTKCTFYMFTRVHTHAHPGPKDNLNPQEIVLIYFHLIGLLLILEVEKIPKNLW